MKGQPKLYSFYEQLANQLIGYGTAYLTNVIVLPLIFGVSVSHKQVSTLIIIFMTISIIRSYLCRRLFNWISIRRKHYE